MSRRPSFDYLIGLAEIERAAAAGEAAPTNKRLGAILGAKSATAGENCVRHLEKHGLISVERFHYARRFTIVATGKSTAKPKNARPPVSPQEAMAAPRGRRTYAEIAETIVPPSQRRDPCPRCGVRADVGCSHGWQP